MSFQPWHPEEACHLVAKTCIIGMLHYRHQLNSIVAESSNAWHNIVCKISVCWHTTLWRRNPNMGFINAQRAWLLPMTTEVWVLPFIGARWRPVDCFILACLLIVHSIACPRRQPVYFPPVSCSYTHLQGKKKQMCEIQCTQETSISFIFDTHLP